MPKSSTSKQAICEAAVRVAGRDGLSAMSLDVVAREAGVTKGGLLYHYRSKEDLVHATLEHFTQSARQMILERIAADPTPHLRWARGFVTCLFPSEDEAAMAPGEMGAETLKGFMLAMMSVAADRKVDLGPLQTLGKEIRGRLLEDSETGMDQLLVWLALDGLLVWQVLGLIEPNDPLYEQIGDTLRERVGLPARRTAPPPPKARKKPAKKKGAPRG